MFSFAPLRPMEISIPCTASNKQTTFGNSNIYASLVIEKEQCSFPGKYLSFYASEKRVNAEIGGRVFVIKKPTNPL